MALRVLFPAARMGGCGGEEYVAENGTIVRSRQLLWKVSDWARLLLFTNNRDTDVTCAL